MIFTEFSFLIFFLVAASVHWALRGHTSRKRWLLLCSYFFYGYWDYRFLGLILLDTVIDYFAALGLGRARDERTRRLLITLSLCANLGMLGFFKYYNFFVESGCQLLHTLGADVATPSLKIVLPVGISFFTFQSMSFTLDVYRRKITPHRDFLDFALFVSFFPQLVAGPIVRASAFLPQLESPRTFASVDVRRALLLFAIGYFKKACVADNIAAVIDPLFANPTSYDAHARLLGATLYSVQIYCDFSGYTDMATGVAAFFGYQLAKNFDAPYLSRNVREFWQRWHISLSSWLRDYLYIPLGGNRGGELRVAKNLMLTMLLGGLWHGANWTFIVWGFLHGAALVVQRMFGRLRGSDTRAPGAGPLPGALGVLSWALTFAWVAFCFTIFRCADITTAWELFTGATHPGGGATLSMGLWLALAVLGTSHYLIWTRKAELVARSRRLPDAVFYPALGAACALLVYLTPVNLSPFIYFQF